MNIVEMIARSHNGRGLDVVGEQFGLSREQTQRLLVANPRAVFEHAPS